MDYRKEADGILDDFKLGLINLKEATEQIRKLMSKCKHTQTSVGLLNGEWASECDDCGKIYIDSVGEWE